MNKKSKELGIFLLALAAVVLIVVLVLSGKPKETPEGDIFSQKPKDCIPLSSTGKKTYDTRTDIPKNFVVAEVALDPIDVAAGETQTITVKVKEKGADTITRESEVMANIITDNKNTAVRFKLIRAEDEMASDGSIYLVTLWQGLWIREDDNCQTYRATIIAKNYRGDEASLDLAFR